MHILLPERKRLTRLLTFECFVTLFGYVYVRPESVLTNDHRVSKHFCYKNVWRQKTGGVFSLRSHRKVG